MRRPLSEDKQTFVSDYDKDNAAATLTITPAAGEYVVIDWLMFSYSADPAAGKELTIAFGSTTIKLHVTNGGPGKLSFREGKTEGLMAGKGEAVTITLAASGTAGNKGCLAAAYR